MMTMAHSGFVDKVVEYHMLKLVWWCYLGIVRTPRKIAGDVGREYLVYIERV